MVQFRGFMFRTPLQILLETPDGGSGGGATGGDSGSSSQGGSPPLASPGSASSSGTGLPSQSGTQGQPTQPVNRDPVAFDRFSEVNERAKRLSWAEQYNPDQVREATRLYEWFDTDPEGAYEYVKGLLTRNGILKEQAQPRQQARGNGHDAHVDANGRPLPDILVQETGQRLYSAEQAQRLTDWVMDKMDERLKPLEEFRGSTTVTMQARSEAQRQIAEAESSWPYFNEFAPQINQELAKDRRLSLEGAYRRVVVPQIRQRERAALVTEMKSRGGGSTTNPNAPAPSRTEEMKKLSIKELFRREMQRRGMGR